MNTEMLFDVLELVPENYKTEVLNTMEKKNTITGVRRKKLLKVILIAAAIACLMSASAYAIGNAINSPEAAERAARQEIETWKEMGLLSDKVAFIGEADDVYEEEEHTGDEYWYGRIFRHRYDVRWYGRNGKYSGNICVDTATGKLYAVTIDAKADEDDTPVGSTQVEQPIDGDPEKGFETKTWYFYENYGDIFPEDITVDKFCSLLAEYWGFSGYTLSDTHDGFYNEDWDAVGGDTLLKELPQENYYLTIFFEGDQSGVPMYLQLNSFPGCVSLMLGTNHALG